MKTFAGWSLISLALIMLLGFFNSKASAGLGTEIASLIILVALPMIGGISLLYSQSKNKQGIQQSKQKLAQKSLDAEILRFAGQNDGKLTVVEVATQFALSVTEAEDVLDQLAQRGLADYEVTDSGLMVYTFADIRHLKEKSQSKGVLDA